jgi:hypothetical protein
MFVSRMYWASIFEIPANQRAASPLIQVEPLDANMLQVLHESA